MGKKNVVALGIFCVVFAFQIHRDKLRMCTETIFICAARINLEELAPYPEIISLSTLMACTAMN